MVSLLKDYLQLLVLIASLFRAGYPKNGSLLRVFATMIAYGPLASEESTNNLPITTLGRLVSVANRNWGCISLSLPCAHAGFSQLKFCSPYALLEFTRKLVLP